MESSDEPDHLPSDRLFGPRRVALRLLAAPMIVGAAWYSLVYAHFAGFFEHLGVPLHLLEFAPTQHGVAAKSCYVLLWHGALAFATFHENAARSNGVPRSPAPDAVGGRVETALGNLLALGSLVNLVLWLVYGGSATRAAAIGGSIGGTLAHLATKLRDADLRRWAAGVLVIGTLVTANQLGHVDSASALRDRQFPIVLYRLENEAQPRSGCLIARNGGRYFFLEYQVGANQQSHKVVSIRPETGVTALEIRTLAEGVSGVGEHR